MQIAFISSALSPEDQTERESFDFFAVLLNGIVSHGQTDDSQVVVFVPTKTGALGSDQESLVRRVLEIASEFHAIVIAPFKTDTVAYEIKQHFDNLPISDDFQCKALVFIDKAISPADLGDNIEDKILIKNFSCNNKQGGIEAADILLQQFDAESIPVNDQYFMVLEGLQGGEDRRKGFVDRIGAIHSGKAVSRPDSDLLNFTRAKARSWMARELDKLFGGKTNEFGQLHENVSWGIFACNDEMALGIRSVISDKYQVYRRLLAEEISQPSVVWEKAREYLIAVTFLQRIRIVGFDGIAAALDLIEAANDDHHENWLIGTIRAQVERQSSEAIKWLKLLDKHPLRGKSEVDPVVLPVDPVRRR